MPVTYAWSGAASHTAFGPLTTGRCRKLYAGGGEATDHSSVSAFHGFAPAATPPRRLTRKLMMVMSTEIAMNAAPAEASALIEAQCIPGWYVYTRLGMPSSPRICMGKNVTLKPMSSSQNESFPSLSLYMRPVHFGNQ